MCEWGDTVSMVLTIPAEYSHTGADYDKPVAIDRCIAPVVKALNAGGVSTVASCCGHKKGFGSIILRDGRELLVCPDYETARYLDTLTPDIHGEWGDTDGE